MNQRSWIFFILTFLIITTLQAKQEDPQEKRETSQVKQEDLQAKKETSVKQEDLQAKKETSVKQEDLQAKKEISVKQDPQAKKEASQVKKDLQAKRDILQGKNEDLQTKQDELHKNWLIGLSGGYEVRSGDLNVSVAYTHPNFVLAGIQPNNVSRKITDTGFIWGFIIGYQASYNRWLVGSEFNIDWDNIDELHTYAFSDPFAIRFPGSAFDATVRYERGTTIGFSFRAGYKLARFLMPYLRLGLETSRDKLETTFSGRPTVYPFTGTFERSRQEYRFLAGGGFEIPLLREGCFSARAEYNYHSKGKQIDTTGMITDGLFSQPLFESDARPVAHTGKISLIWNIP